MPGPASRSNQGVTPRTWRGANGTISIDPVWSVGITVPFVCTSVRVPAGSPVVLRSGALNNVFNPLSVAAGTSIRDNRLCGSTEVVTDTLHQCVGVATNDVELDEMGIAASFGSIVNVKCADASVDTPLASVGTWVRVSDSTAGEVVSCDAADIVGNLYDGAVVGRIVIPAGSSGSGNTGSLTSCVVFITLGY